MDNQFMRLPFPSTRAKLPVKSDHQYEVFSWLEYVVTVPNPIFLVTTRKANGAPNY